MQVSISSNTLRQMQSLILKSRNISVCRDPTASSQGVHCLTEVWNCNLLLFTGYNRKELTLCKSRVSYTELLFSQTSTKKKKSVFHVEYLFVFLCRITTEDSKYFALLFQKKKIILLCNFHF